MKYIKWNWKISANAAIKDQLQEIIYLDNDSKNGTITVSMPNTPENYIEIKANAKLISAAPELAEICYGILQLWHAKSSNMYKKEPDHLEKIRKALKKAGI